MNGPRQGNGGQGRPLDVGYRGYDVPAWFGSFGVIKGQLPGAVKLSAEAAGLRCDISTRYEDTIYGDDWYQFLLGCRWTLGIEGGASLLDRDGSLRAAAEQFVAQHPRATYEEIARNCFASQDGNLELTAISPRHLEAGMTGTGQLLVEGHYNGILRPGVHYLPVRRDLADLEERVAQLADETSRMKLVQAMDEDVVRNPAYGYPRFVARLLEECLPARPTCGGSTENTAANLDRLCRRAWRQDARWRWRFGVLRAASRRMPPMLRGSWLTSTLRRWLYPMKNR